MSTRVRVALLGCVLMSGCGDRAVAPRGAPLHSGQVLGHGPCAGTTLAQVISAVHRQRPELKDISAIYKPDPERVGDGSFIYAFDQAAGFALAFRRGGGDCPSGCTENEYWYFATDHRCAPMQVGHYRPSWESDCLRQEGAPMWGVPPAPDPAVVCGADNQAKSVSGTYAFRGVGMRSPCATKGSSGGGPVTLSLSMTVTQSAGDPGRGTVVVTGTGEPRLDGLEIPATFLRQRFTAKLAEDNLPAMCIDQRSIEVTYDFEAAKTGMLRFFEVRSVGCPPSQDYCKGALTLELTREN